VLRAKSSLDKRNPWLLTTKTSLAMNLLDQSLLDQACIMAEDVLEASGSSVTVDAENVLACVDVLATSLFRQGKKEEAGKKRRDLLSTCEAQLGKTHPFTLDAAYSLGEFYGDEGAYDKAQDLYIPVLQHFRDVQQLGKDAVKVATLLAVTYREQGKFDNAENLCIEAIGWCEDAFGENHIETLSLYNVLGRIYLERGQRPLAETLYDSVLSKLEEHHHGNELEIYVKNNVAELRRQQGNPESAHELMREALTLTETRHGKRHPASINMAGNVLGASLNKHLTDELEQWALETIKVKEQILGVTHPSTIKTISDLAYAYGDNGRFEDAQRLYKGIEESGGLEALQQLVPARYAIFCGKLADLYFREDQLEKAQELEERALAIRKQLYGDNHNATLVSMANLASTLHAQEKYAQAEGYLRHIVAVREENANADSQSLVKLLKSRVDLAATLFFEDKFDEAAELYRDSLEASDMLSVDSSITDIWKADFEKVLENLPKQELPEA
jgi:tetratricopeptide (TPR) repeat protein